MNNKRSLDEAKLLYVKNRREWRDWLKSHYKSEKEVWLVYYKKHSGKPRIPYNDAVEEALCFGWIDSTVKRIDEDRFAQRFSLRNPKTPYSQSNKELLGEMVKQGKVADEVLATLENLAEERFEIPPDISDGHQGKQESPEELSNILTAIHTDPRCIYRRCPQKATGVHEASGILHRDDREE